MFVCFWLLVFEYFVSVVSVISPLLVFQNYAGECKAVCSKGLTSKVFNYGMLMLIDMQTHERWGKLMNEYHTVIWIWPMDSGSNKSTLNKITKRADSWLSEAYWSLSKAPWMTSVKLYSIWQSPLLNKRAVSVACVQLVSRIRIRMKKYSVISLVSTGIHD